MILEADSSAPFAALRFAARIPKSGGQAAECEDRFDTVAQGSLFRAAVADGASASLLAGEWAEMLTAAYCANDDDEALALARRIGDQAVAWTAMANAIDLPWYARAKRSDGAFAALIGVDIRRDGRWTAMAAGDSCVFQVRRRTDVEAGATGCVLSFPMATVGQFGSTPALIGTDAAPDPGVFSSTAGSWRAGDDLYLMTDALAEWFIGELQQTREPWRWFEALESTGNALAFDRLVKDLRASRKLKDDDVTLLHIKLSGVELEADR